MESWFVYGWKNRGAATTRRRRIKARSKTHGGGGEHRFFPAESADFKAGLEWIPTMAFERIVGARLLPGIFQNSRWIPSRNRVKTVGFPVKEPLPSIDPSQNFLACLDHGQKKKRKEKERDDNIIIN